MSQIIEALSLINMKGCLKRSCRALLLSLILAFIINLTAVYVTTAADETVTLSSSGIWVSASGGSGVIGAGTNEIRWGNVVSPYNKKEWHAF